MCRNNNNSKATAMASRAPKASRHAGETGVRAAPDESLSDAPVHSKQGKPSFVKKSGTLAEICCALDPTSQLVDKVMVRQHGSLEKPGPRPLCFQQPVAARFMLSAAVSSNAGCKSPR